MNYNIAIDGPAGAGKSTIAKLLASKNNYIYVDTGLMYRAVSYYMYTNEIDYNDEKEVVKKLDNVNINLVYENNSQRVMLNNNDVTDYLREEQIGKIASIVAVIPEVRKKLVSLQKEIAQNNNVVMDGRDIGTVVLPNANLKIFLDSKVDIRAKRRYDELKEKNKEKDYEDIKKDIMQRDYTDSTRKTSPLKKADDAIYIDASDLTISEVLEKIESLIN